jgi:hypothetical protein
MEVHPVQQRSEQLSGSKRSRMSPPQIEDAGNATCPRAIAHDLQSMCAEKFHETRGLQESTSIAFDRAPDFTALGSVHLLRIPRGAEMRIHATARRIKGGSSAVFRLESMIRGIDIDFVALAQLVIAHIELSVRQNTAVGYSVEVALTTTTHRCISIVAPIPSDTEDGTEVILRRVSVAGCDVPLGKAVVRVIVGFNHEPGLAGRLYAE